MLAGEVRKAVLEPGVADKPNFISTPLGGAIGHLRGFIFAAHWRVLGQAYQQFGERPAQIMAGLTTMVALAYGIGELKAAVSGYHSQGTFGEKMLNAIESSAVTGAFGDMNAMLETVTGNTLGVRPLLGADPKTNNPNVSDAGGAVLGTVASQWGSLAWAYGSSDATDSDRAKALRYMVPFNNLWFLSRMFSSLEHSIT